MISVEGHLLVPEMVLQHLLLLLMEGHQLDVYQYTAELNQILVFDAFHLILNTLV